MRWEGGGGCLVQQLPSRRAAREAAAARARKPYSPRGALPVWSRRARASHPVLGVDRGPSGEQQVRHGQRLVLGAEKRHGVERGQALLRPGGRV